MNIPEIEFKPFRKIARWKREILVSEKIDGTNSTVYIDDSGQTYTASRNRWITPGADNYGFAAWVEGNKQELLKLGAGWHVGEWWGAGIQRGYGLKEKRFSLFNTRRFCAYGQTPAIFINADPKIPPFTQIVLPECVGLVPVLYSGPLSEYQIEVALNNLVKRGSVAAPGYMKPEGIVVYLTAADVYLKQLIENDSAPKGKQT